MWTRRTVLKSLALLPLLEIRTLGAAVSDTPEGLFYVLLHGLLFMEYQPVVQGGKTIDGLIVRAPMIPDHKLWCGSTAQGIQLCNAPEISWLDKGLTGDFTGQPSVCKVIDDVKVEIPQFSRTATGVDDFDDSNVMCKITLPWPVNFYSIRTDVRPTFTSKPSRQKTGKPVKDSLNLCSGNTLGLVTVLQYLGPVSKSGSDAAVCAGKYHYFFEHDPSTGDDRGINDHLQHAAAIFKVPSEFDLQVDPNDVGHVSCIQNNGLPSCIDPTDEYSYHERKCLQEGIPSRFPSNPQHASRSSRSTQHEINTLAAQDCKSCVQRFSSSANCPNLFVGG